MNAISFDFDGVIHKYSKGWQDGSIYDEINQEVLHTIYDFHSKGTPIFICSTRNPQQIVDFWNKQNLKVKAEVIPDNVFFFDRIDYIGVTQRKLPAMFYIDDRGINYSGQSRYELSKLIEPNSAK